MGQQRQLKCTQCLMHLYVEFFNFDDMSPSQLSQSCVSLQVVASDSEGLLPQFWRGYARQLARRCLVHVLRGVCQMLQRTRTGRVHMKTFVEPGVWAHFSCIGQQSWPII